MGEISESRDGDDDRRRTEESLSDDFRGSRRSRDRLRRFQIADRGAFGTIARSGFERVDADATRART
jgi:hypothetical protein